jgi:RES domain-containing protein
VASEPLALFPEPQLNLVAFRWSSYDVPFWARPNTRPGRWNLADGTSTQYWSLTPEAAWAELIRFEDLQTEADLDLVRMPFWACRAASAMVVDLRRPDVREEFGIAEEQLISEDWSACQELSELLRERARGVIAPCAALPEHGNLTMFGARRAIKWDKSPALTSVLPATKAAVGRPPDGLIDRVRRRPTPSPEPERLF